MLEDPSPTGLGGLTAREAAIMEHLIEGMSNRRIAEHLQISEGRVMYDRLSIYRKLNVKGASEAIRAWLRLKPDASMNLEALTKTDVTVLEAIVKGCSTDKAIAEHFGVSQQSIQIHMKGIFLKLGVSSHAAAVTVWEYLKNDASRPRSTQSTA